MLWCKHIATSFYAFRHSNRGVIRIILSWIWEPSHRQWCALQLRCNPTITTTPPPPSPTTTIQPTINGTNIMLLLPRHRNKFLVKFKIMLTWVLCIIYNMFIAYLRESMFSIIFNVECVSLVCLLLLSYYFFHPLFTLLSCIFVRFAFKTIRWIYHPIPTCYSSNVLSTFIEPHVNQYTCSRIVHKTQVNGQPNRVVAFMRSTEIHTHIHSTITLSTVSCANLL